MRQARRRVTTGWMSGWLALLIVPVVAGERPPLGAATPQNPLRASNRPATSTLLDAATVDEEATNPAATDGSEAPPAAGDLEISGDAATVDESAERPSSRRAAGKGPRRAVQVQPVENPSAGGESAVPTAPAPRVRRSDRTAAAPRRRADLPEPPRPGETPASPASPASDAGEAAGDDDAPTGDDETELVRERYPSGELKVERHVRRDPEGNLVNDGPWIMWTPQGQKIGAGSYRRGQRDGHWVRVFRPGEGEMFRGPLYQKFQPPFTAQADFHHGQLDGPWIISDARGRMISRWEFSQGQREGKLTWWYPNGQKWREVDYHAHEVDGALVEWTPDGRAVTQAQYVAGRRQTVEAQWYPNGRKRSEGEYLAPREITVSSYDFWNGVARIEITGSEGEVLRHGKYVAWFPTGQVQMQGQFDHDAPVGAFTWWHGNGQISAKGTYLAGERRGRWMWWDREGNVASSEDFAPVDVPHMARTGYRREPVDVVPPLPRSVRRR